eukprot:15171750-Heterocapsa_arctica.AAC.1
MTPPLLPEVSDPSGPLPQSIAPDDLQLLVDAAERAVEALPLHDQQEIVGEHRHHGAGLVDEEHR